MPLEEKQKQRRPPPKKQLQKNASKNFYPIKQLASPKENKKKLPLPAIRRPSRCTFPVSVSHVGEPTAKIRFTVGRAYSGLGKNHGFRSKNPGLNWPTFILTLTGNAGSGFAIMKMATSARRLLKEQILHWTMSVERMGVYHHINYRLYCRNHWKSVLELGFPGFPAANPWHRSHRSIASNTVHPDTETILNSNRTFGLILWQGRSESWKTIL